MVIIRNPSKEILKSVVHPEEIKEFIKNFCYVDSKVAKKIYDYFELQYKYIGIPHNKKIIIENYKGERDYWIFHALFGRRVNDALSRAVAFCLARLGGRDVEVGINDNGFYIVGEKINEEKIKKAINFLNEKNIEEVLKEAIDKTELLKRRFRHCAVRSLIILRKYKGRAKSVGKQQLKSGFILGAIKRLSEEFPILKEAKREILEDVMDIKNSRKILEWIREGKIKIEFKKTEMPSPFSLNLIMQSRVDLIKMEDKIEFLKRVYKMIKEKVR